MVTNFLPLTTFVDLDVDLTTPLLPPPPPPPLLPFEKDENDEKLLNFYKY